MSVRDDEIGVGDRISVTATETFAYGPSMTTEVIRIRTGTFAEVLESGAIVEMGDRRTLRYSDEVGRSEVKILDKAIPEPEVGSLVRFTVDTDLLIFEKMETGLWYEPFYGNVYTWEQILRKSREIDGMGMEVFVRANV